MREKRSGTGEAATMKSNGGRISRVLHDQMNSQLNRAGVHLTPETTPIGILDEKQGKVKRVRAEKTDDRGAAKTIRVAPINIARCIITVTGLPPGVLPHQFSQRAIDTMMGKQEQTDKATPKTARDPWRDFIESLYVVTQADIHAMSFVAKETPRFDGNEEREVLTALMGGDDATLSQFTYGIRANAFKSSVVKCARFLKGVHMTELAGIFFVLGRFIPIIGPPPVMQRDAVRLESGVASATFRPLFYPWSCDLNIEYDSDLVSVENLVNLFNRAGFHIGVGDWRREKKKGNPGIHGGYRVTGVKIVEVEEQ